MKANGSLYANNEGNSETGIKPLHQLYTGLQSYSHFLTKNKWDAEDLTQETFLKAMEYYQSNQVSSALLKKMAYHHWIDTTRKRKRELVGDVEEKSESVNQIKSEELLDTIKLLVSKLTPKQSIVFILKEAFCFQAKEIAELLETTENAVKSSLHRLRKRLEMETQLQSVDSYWNEDEREFLFNLLYQSVQAENPAMLINWISNIPSLAEAPKLAKRKHSASPLNFYCLAA